MLADPEERAELHRAYRTRVNHAYETARKEGKEIILPAMQHIKEIILPAMQHIEAADPSRQLAGLKHMLKGEERLKEKIADILFTESGLTVRHALVEEADAVRFTLACSRQRFAERCSF